MAWIRSSSRLTPSSLPRSWAIEPRWLARYRSSWARTSRHPLRVDWYSGARALWKRSVTCSGVMFPTRSTWSRVASPRKESISCTSHWKSSVVSGVSGRIQADPRRRTAPMRWSFRQTPTRCRVGVGGNVVRRVSQRMSDKVTLDTRLVKRYTSRQISDGGRPWKRRRRAQRVPIRELVRYYLRLGPDRLRRSRRPRGPDGARAGRASGSG